MNISIFMDNSQYATKTNKHYPGAADSSAVALSDFAGKGSWV